MTRDVVRKAMLLAAGEGRRMLPLTQDTPKPLLPVVTDTLIGHQLQRIRAAGLSQVVINVAYLGQQIIDRLGSGGDYNVVIEYSQEPEPLETAGGINRALPLLGHAPFVLVNGDVWCDYELAKLVDFPLYEQSLGHLILVPNPNHNPSGDFALQAGQIIAGVSEQTYTYSGLALLRPELILHYPQRRERFGLKEVFDWAIAQGRLTGEVHTGHWLDVGTPERLDQLRMHLR